MANIIGLEHIKKLTIHSTTVTSNLQNKIHLLKNGDKYKEFHPDYQDLNEPENISFKNDLAKQTELPSDQAFSFPKIIIADEQILHGYIGLYETGTPLSALDANTTIDHILYALEYLESSIETITAHHCQIEDLHDDNILLSDHKVAVIDTDFYTFNEAKTFLELYRTNLRQFFNTTINTIIPKLNQTSIWQDPEVKESYSLATQGHIKISDFLKYLLLKLKLLAAPSPPTVQVLRNKLKQ